MWGFLNENKKIIRCLVLLSVVGMLCVGLSVNAFADVGNSVDYSGGSSSSFGGSGSYRTSASGFDIYMIYYLINLMIREPLIAIIVIAIVAMYIVGKAKQRSLDGGRRETVGHRSYQPHQQTQTQMQGNMASNLMSDRQSIAALVGKDPQFSEQMLVGKVNNMFMRLQLAWMNKKWEEVRPFETDALFNTHKMQLEQYIANNRTNRMEDISIINTELLRYYEVGEYEYLDVEIRARFIDYVEEDGRKILIKGSKTVPVKMQYKWKLARKRGLATNVAHVEATECPNCGANISINQAGRCEYCDSIVTKGDFDWVLSEIEVVSQYK